MACRLYRFSASELATLKQEYPIALGTPLDPRFNIVLVECLPFGEDPYYKYVVYGDETDLDDFELETSLAPAVDAGRTDMYWQVDEGKIYSDAEDFEIAYPDLPPLLYEEVTLDVTAKLAWLDC